MSIFKNHPTTLDTTIYPEDFSPCHRRVLSARNIPAEQLHKNLSDLIPVGHLTDAHTAAQRIYKAINNNEKIVIVGDYDADGATAMAVMVSVLRHLKASHDSVVPNRKTMGYGLSPQATEQAIAKGAQLLITVDNGISANSAVEHLNEHAIDVIITDHHMPPETLPNAYAIVNPNRNDCRFASGALAGVGVAFYLILALRQVFREHSDSRLDSFNVTSLLPYVAIGTISDVVPMDFNNRILVEQGLKRIRAGHAPIGINALIDVTQVRREHITASDIGFQIGPRLNAVERIADMQLGVDCLLENNERLATDYAIELNRLNHERRTIENEMRMHAEQLLSSHAADEQQACLCLYDKTWNEGLIGILASRIKDSYNTTAFAFTMADNGMLKASARAADGVNIIAALNQLNRDQPEVLITYGGHTKAAGLSIEPTHLEIFDKTITAIIDAQLQTVDIDSAIYTDGELLPYEINLANAEFLRTLEPWGHQLPEPLFENTFYVDQVREVGKNHAQLAIIEEQSGKYFRGIAFNQFSDCDRLVKTQCRIAYTLSVNEWRGERSLSLNVAHIIAR